MLSNRNANLLRLVHRFGGLVLAVFLFIAAITGIMLNHTDRLGLAEQPVPGAIASRYYDVDSTTGIAAGDHYFYRVGSGLFMDKILLDTCESELTGVAILDREIAIGCGSELLLVTSAGELIERLGVAHGYPEDVLALGARQGALVLKTDRGYFRFDVQALVAEPTDVGVPSPMLVPVPMALLSTDAVSFEQFVLDLHSGRYLGQAGVWLADLVAICLVLLALSGIVMAMQPRRHGNGNRQ